MSKNIDYEYEPFSLMKRIFTEIQTIFYTKNMNWGNLNEMACLVIYTFLLQHLLLLCPSTPH